MAIKKSIIEASKMFGDAIHGDFQARGALQEIVTSGQSRYMSEAISTSDVLSAFNTSVTQTVLAQYNPDAMVWNKIAKRNIVEDFKLNEFVEFQWDNDLLVGEAHGIEVPSGSLARIPELDEYPTFRYEAAAKQFKIHKSGARLPFSWEWVINGEWARIGSIPEEMLRKAERTEESQVVQSFVGTTGPRADVFAGATAVDNKPLTFENLSLAKTVVRQRKVNGRNVTVGKFALVVPPALEEVAKQILSITTFELTDGDKKYTQTAGNGDIELVVMPALNWVDKSAKADSTWYLLPVGGDDGTRTSILQNFLRRHEKPELRISNATGLYIGGGAVPGLEGSLLNDDIEYRIRHVVTGFVLNSDAMYASVPA